MRRTEVACLREATLCLYIFYLLACSSNVKFESYHLLNPKNLVVYLMYAAWAHVVDFGPYQCRASINLRPVRAWLALLDGASITGYLYRYVFPWRI